MELEAIRQQIAEFGDRAYLVTVTDDQRPHVVSAVVRLGGDHLVVGAGRRTRANLAARPMVTLLWPPVTDDGEYSLLVDGTVDLPIAEECDVAITPTSAVLHRVAGAAGDGPNCLPVGAD